jgi:membrane carboxypeptidase/penicillin-binding protein PbpC
MEPPYESTTLKAIYEGTERVSYKWYVNNILQASVADSLVIDRPTEANPHNKNVRLETTSQYNCTGTSWVTITYNVGIDDVDALKVSVYPNPASRYLNLESAEGISNVTVYNALGQQVIARSVNAENVQLNLSSLAIGNYTLRIVSPNGKESTRKFIVNK